MADECKFEKPRGTRDFGPDEMYRRRLVEKNMRECFERFGYREIQTPTFENLELLTAKSGEGIIDELYDFTDKGGRRLALRPELTAPVMRFYVNEMQRETKPLKLFYLSNCFRYDRPQKGRYREFWQIGCELIGPNSPLAHSEVISLAYEALKSAGVQQIVLRVGSLGVLKPLITGLGLDGCDERAAMRLIDKSEYESLEKFLSEKGVGAADAKRFLATIRCKSIPDARALLSDSIGSELSVAFDYLDNVMRLLDSFGVANCTLDLAIARGLEYYTGLVFEIDAPLLGAEKQLCGGGCYSLVPLFGGLEVPTSGFAIGFDRTIVALEEEEYSFETPRSTDAFIVPVGDGGRLLECAAGISATLRKAGKRVEVDLMARSVGKALKYADKIGVKKAVLVGENELEKGAVLVKDLVSGEQMEVELRRLPECV
ncbi:MAG: histidine--tRNA ligase [Thermoplasmata archaeon HGW-Thermoplasmata-1]|nr:MAG: histidine--tRNA ligase [Thermoplasmata archaeon HGW-Thermoplasmata-1]